MLLNKTVWDDSRFWWQKISVKQSLVRQGAELPGNLLNHFHPKNRNHSCHPADNSVVDRAGMWIV